MKLLRRLQALFRKEKLDAEMSEEMRLHLERRTEENVAAGMQPDEARYAALRKFGGVEQVKELAREGRAFVWLEQTWQDVRYALRQLARAKGFTFVVVATLALGIGAITAIYSVVDGVLLNPIPGPAADQVVQIGRWIYYQNRSAPARAGLVLPALEALEANRDFFSELTWCDSVQLERKGDDFSTIAFGTMVPPDFFAVLGVRPLLGRTFASEEAVAVESLKPMGDTTLILSHRWWKSEFAGDPKVLGRVVEMGGRRFTVVGVMPEYFQFPGGDFWLPVQRPRQQPHTMQGGNIMLLARLKPGVTLPQTQAMLATVERRIFEDFPVADRPLLEFFLRAGPGGRLWALPLREAMQDPSFGPGYENLRRTLFGLLAAIGFVLAIVCANVANLTLARTEQRQHELVVRAALGAGRSRLMRQLLTENLLLALFGGAAGLVVAAWGIKLLVAFNTMPRLRPIELDGHVLTIAFAASVITGLVFGLVPAWRAGRVRLNETLTQGGLCATASGHGARYRNALVIGEVALAVVLLTGAGLMIQSVVKLLHVDPGFDPANLVSVEMNVPATMGEGLPKRNATLALLHDRLATLPGVSAVGIIKDGFWEEKVMLDGRTEPVLLNRAHSGWEDSDYFRAARIPLASGRAFERGDVGENATAVIVNETLARLCWSGENALGKKLRVPQQRGERIYEVVGVVRDARVYRFDENLRPVFYRPYAEAPLTGMPDRLVVRTQQDPGGIIPAIRKELKAGAPRLRMPYISVFRQTLYDATRAQRTYRNYLAVFAGVGLLLAALGIYGVLAYSVARRTREIGIRIAVGAERWHVMGMVMRDGVWLIGIGAVVGVVAAFWLTKFLQKQLFGVSPHDPVVLAAVVVMLAAVALVACWIPARRATKVDPIVALRCE
jgi:predicted permease